jgi:gas vesicle protein
VVELTTAALLLADDTGTSADVATFAQYGVLGIIAALLIFFAKGAHQRERDRADRLEEENRKLNALILDRVIPALISATRAAEESTELLNAVQRERERRGAKGAS